MAITVKKKSLTLKSEAPGAVPAGAEEESAVVTASVQRGTAARRKSGGSFVPYAIIGLIACALLGALIALQVIENSFYTGAIPQHGAVAGN